MAAEVETLTCSVCGQQATNDHQLIDWVAISHLGKTYYVCGVHLPIYEYPKQRAWVYREILICILKRSA